MIAYRTIYQEQKANDFPYYRPVWRKVVLILLAVSFLPLIVIGGGVSYFAFSKLEALTLTALRAQVLMHQQSIDRFLTEREQDLKMIAGLYTVHDLIQPGRLESVLAALQRQTPGFMDLGIIDMQGRHLAYVGPFPLHSRNYSDEPWFRALGERDSHISDVYLGFRQVPHFIMAVRQGQGKAAWILRATIDSDYFDALVAAGPAVHKAQSYIVNREGRYQTRTKNMELLSPSGLDVHSDPGEIRMRDKGSDLIFTLWQNKVPWLNVVQVRRNDVYFGLNQIRLLVIITFMAGAVVVIGTVLWTTGKLFALLEAKGQSLRMLDRQLRRTSYLASSMELSTGFFEELKDILANIDVSVQYLAGHGADEMRQEGRDTLAQITCEASRGHALIDKFRSFVQAGEPIVTDVQVTDLLDDLLSFLHKELARRSIRIHREYQEPLALIRSDRGKLRQVFQNLLLNAIAAVDHGGEIRLIARSDAQQVTVSIRDNGSGIASIDQAKIFEPLYTTKPQGTGMGLSMCRAILDHVGGKISVVSQPGQGATFTVELPCQMGVEREDVT